MNDHAASTHGNSGSSFQLAANGTMLILAGLLLGPAIGVAPYPRLMLSAHSIFLGVGMLSILAAALLKTSLASVGRRSARLVVFAHVLEWVLCLSQVAGAFWGTNKALSIAGAQAGAPGGAPWQESLVLVCQLVPSLFLLLAWAILVWGVFRAHTSGE
jgi:hypothetical protein